jgi:hypothetical protein
MVVIRRKYVRAASVPVDEEPVTLNDSALNAHRTRLISNAALDDSDAMSAASRRNDQQLMSDINARIAHASYSQPSPVLSRRSVHRSTPVQPSKPPLPNRNSMVNEVIMSSKERKSDNDVNHDVDLMMPLTSRVLRAGSVPPLSSRAVLMSEPVVKTRIIRNGPVVVQQNGPIRLGSYVQAEPVGHTRYIVQKNTMPDSYYYYPQSAAHLTPTADLAVRQAHRNLDRIEHELKTDSTLAPPASPLPAIRTYATIDTGPRRRTSSYHGPMTRLRTRSPSPSYVGSSGHPFSAYSSLPDYSSLPYSPVYRTSSSVSYPSDAQVVTTTTRKHIVSSEPEYYRTALPDSLAGLSYVSAVDRVPTYSTSKADIDRIIAQANVLPEVPRSTYKPSSAGVSSYNPAPVSSSTGLPPTSKPKISETRRRVRDVLCKVKGDPKYFD